MRLKVTWQLVNQIHWCTAAKYSSCNSRINASCWLSLHQASLGLILSLAPSAFDLLPFYSLLISIHIVQSVLPMTCWVWFPDSQSFYFLSMDLIFMSWCLWMRCDFMSWCSGSGSSQLFNLTPCSIGTCITKRCCFC